jgi:DNA/RNA-binding domain of Phe-tRNA-synthetase-like protein
MTTEGNKRMEWVASKRHMTTEGNKRMEWVASKRHMTAEHRLARAVQTLQADVHSSPASSRMNRQTCRFKLTRPFRRKTKSGS